MPNAWNKRVYMKGEDPKEALDNAAYVVDDEFLSSRQPHMSSRRTAATPYYDENGLLTIASKSICVYRHQMMIARGVGVPPSRIRVIQNNLGASFGYKVAPTNEPYSR